MSWEADRVLFLQASFWSSARPPWVSTPTAPRQAHRKLIPTEQARERTVSVGHRRRKVVATQLVCRQRLSG